MPNTWLEVTSERGEVMYSGYTDEHGALSDLLLMPGSYVLREVLAPEGYELSKEPLSFRVLEDGSVEGATVIADDVVRFAVQKADENYKPLAGARFGLKTSDGSVLMTAVSDENGMAVFEQVPCGSYVIVELSPPEGYVAADAAIPVTVTPTFLNPTEPLAVVQDKPNEALLKKVDQEGRALAGALFGLFNSDGRQIASAVSDEAGMVRFTRLPLGNCTIRELRAPDGYLLSHDEVVLNVDESWSNTGEAIATVTNQQKRIMLIKVDTSGTPIPGVTFHLIHKASGEIAEAAVSNKDGVVVFTQFDHGDWLVREASVPEGFCGTKDIAFHIGDDWKTPEPIMCVNIPNHFELLKTDASGVPLAGVKFRLENEDGKRVGTYVSDKDGVVRVKGLTPGVYFLKEIETLEGYALSGNVIRIPIDERYVLPEQMPRMVNYTTIQTGVHLAVTGVMWLGIALMLGSCAVMLLRKRQS